MSAATATTTALPQIGEPLSGGIYVGIVTPKGAAPYALILLPVKPAKLLAWNPALAWAKKQGADLFTRPEGALLYANLKDEFDLGPGWHWTNEAASWDDGCAWSQYFYHGTQYYYRKSYEGRARAVRRLELQSFNPLVLA